MTQDNPKREIPVWPDDDDDDQDHWQSLHDVLLRVLEKAERAFQQSRGKSTDAT